MVQKVHITSDTEHGDSMRKLDGEGLRAGGKRVKRYAAKQHDTGGK